MFKEKTLSEKNGQTVVGSSVKLEGDLISEEDIFISGKVLGKVITSKDLIINETAEVKANLEAENISIAGKVEGDIKAREKLEIKETGKVTGNISTSILSVAPGAVFSGQCLMKEAKTEEIKETEGEIIEE